MAQQSVVAWAFFWGSVTWQGCLAALDIRDFALPDPPRLPTWVDPGIRPASYIFGLGQVYPPYDIYASDVPTPFPGCSVQYATSCSVENAIRLVTRARLEVCPALASSDPAVRLEVLSNITTNQAGLQAESATGFGVFVLDQEGYFLADSLKPYLIGQRFDGVNNSGPVPQSSLLPDIDYVVSWGGGFVPHLTTRFKEGQVVTIGGEEPDQASAYFEKCPTGERLGVAFGRADLPTIGDCDNSHNDFCAQLNIRSISGKILVDGLNARYSQDLDKLNYEISFGTAYSLGGLFYAVLTQMGWYGYPGPDRFRNPAPLEDTYWDMVAGGNGMARLGVGRNMTAWVRGTTGDLTTAEYMLGVIGKISWSGGGFTDYQWYTAAMGDHYKITAGLAFVYNGTGLAIGVGMAHVPTPAADGPLCYSCLASVSWPCSLQNAQRLTAHARADSLTLNSEWARISNSAWFGSMHHTVEEDDSYVGTWPSGFFVVVADFNGTIVAHGEHASYVGQDVSVIFGPVSSEETHARFQAAASVADGSWLKFEDASGVSKLARVAQTAKDGRFFYIFSSFDLTAPEWISACSSSYAEPCSEQNAQALIGMAAADLLAAEDESSLDSTITTIVNSVGAYSQANLGDFRAYVLDWEGECLSNSGGCPTTWPLVWKEAVVDLGASQDGGWAILEETSLLKATLAFVVRFEWRSPLSSVTQELLLVTLVEQNAAPAQCTDSSNTCPENAKCSGGRCVCSYGFKGNFTEDAASCGALPRHNLECVDVHYKVCDDSLNCEDCPAGYFCPDGVAQDCLPGVVCPGTSDTFFCPKGTMNNSTRATDASFCVNCPIGSYSDSEGSTTCTPCATGTASNNVGQTACQRCEVGTYQEDEGATECHSCPAGRTTQYRSAVSLDDCVCPTNTYQPRASESCLSCPTGMSCDSENSTVDAIPAVEITAAANSRLLSDSSWSYPYPVAEEGFMVLASSPTTPYKCKDILWCPGGPPGSCARNRDYESVGCSKCQPDTYTVEDGTCEPCEGGAAPALVASVGVGILVVLGVFVNVVNRNQLNQSNSILSVVITLGLTVTAVQTLSIFSNLDVEWPEPLLSMMKVLSLVSFDLKVLKIECVVGQQSVSNMILRQMMAPGAALYIALIVCLKKRFIEPRVHLPSQLINSIGAIFQIFFVAVFLSSLGPVVCYKHPNELGYSMTSDPSILCNQEGEHLSLVVVSVVTIVIVVLPFLAMITYATVRYQSLVGSSIASHHHLMTFRFLFFRYKPDSYYYGCLTSLRGVLVCLVPVVFRDFPSLQLLLMAAILLAFGSFQQHKQPWRSYLPNVIDSTTNTLLILLIVCVSMTTDFEDAEQLLGIVAAVIFIGLFLAILAVICFHLVKYFQPSPFFSSFICHHKAEAAAQARYLQTLIVSRSRGATCFLDSDNLTNLQDLFDIVRCRCGRLIVYLTADTLRRPWCAGEITMAFQTHKNVSAIYHSSFASPTMQEIEADNISTFLAAADFKLVEYGITNELIAQAFRWFLGELPDRYTMRSDLVGRDRLQAVVDWLLKKSGHRSASRSDTLDLKPRSLVVSSTPNDDEATAVAGILVSKIQQRVLDLVPAGIIVLADMPAHNAEVLAAVAAAHAVLVILTPKSFASSEQLQIIVGCTSDQVCCIPVNTPSFRFPGQDFFEKDIPRRFGQQAELVETSIRSFLKCIAVPFTTYASQQVLDVQAESVVLRIPRVLGLASTTSTGPGGKLSGTSIKLMEDHLGDSPEEHTLHNIVSKTELDEYISKHHPHGSVADFALHWACAEQAQV